VGPGPTAGRTVSGREKSLGRGVILTPTGLRCLECTVQCICHKHYKLRDLFIIVFILIFFFLC
jgi:hypothetical protein